MIEQLLTGVMSAGVEGPPGVEFLGEVGVTGFIDGEELASAIGLTTGTAQHTDSPWLHFVLDGKTLYVAKKPYRHSLSWNQINDAGAVFGDKTVIINNKTYKVRLLKTVASGNRYTGSNGSDPVEAHHSEWNRLMYPIHGGNPSQVSGEGIRFGTLAQYTDIDLVARYSAGNGSMSWCQESVSSNTGARVYRGYNGVSVLSWALDWGTALHMGWRPVLELVE